MFLCYIFVLDGLVDLYHLMRCVVILRIILEQMLFGLKHDEYLYFSYSSY